MYAIRSYYAKTKVSALLKDSIDFAPLIITPSFPAFEIDDLKATRNNFV